jgi:cytochrome c-type biogenesis protein CcmH/NrfG
VGVAASLGTTDLQLTEARRTPSFAQGLLLGVAAIAAFGGLSANDANHAAKDAYVGQDRIGAAQRTVKLDAQRALHWRLLGLAYADQQRWRESADAHAESVRLAPYRSDGWISLARARAELVLAGDATARDGSLSAAREGVRRDPREPSARIGLAEVAYELGEYDVALTEAVAAIKLLPTEPHYDDVAAAAAAHAADRSAARRSLEDALTVKDSGTLRTALSRLATGP